MCHVLTVHRSHSYENFEKLLDEQLPTKAEQCFSSSVHQLTRMMECYASEKRQ